MADADATDTPPDSAPGEARPESLADAIVAALAAAGPTAAEHVVTAGNELRRAAEAVVTAVTAAFREHNRDPESGNV